MKNLGRLISTSLIIVLFTALTAWAEEPTADPPGRVARLQYMTGSVSIQPQGTQDWVQGSLNRPLTNADNIWADKDSRAELSLGTGLMRMDSETSLTITSISDNQAQVQLHQGTLNLHVRRLYDGEVYEVDTPNQAFAVSKPGDYRFDVDPNADSTVITVWKGEGQSTGQGPAVSVHAHEQVRFTSGTAMAHESHEAPSPDAFDQWAETRDQRGENSVSARYVSPDTIGYEDLDDNGSWRDVPEYGAVWTPTTVAPGWAPYRYGHWAWIDPWGWTWVDDASWGFAPFHYGRWVYAGGFWGWAPGPRFYRPFYAPALVAWFGGPGFGVSFGFGGGFGWCPLGFGEPFFPWYRGGRGYFRNVNISNTRITNINNVTNNFFNHGGRVQPGRSPMPVHANMNRPNGFTAVARGTLEHSLPVAKNTVRVPESGFRNLAATNRIDANPTREARLGPNAGRPAPVAPQRSLSRPVVSRTGSPMGARGTEVAALHTPVNSTGSRMPERGPAAASPRSDAMTARNIPRPPSAAMPRSEASSESRHYGFGPSEGTRSQPTQMASNRNIPRPPTASQGSSGRSQPGINNRTSPMESNRPSPAPSRAVSSRSVPRPPEGYNYARSTAPAASRGNIPRPTGRVMPASRATYDGSNRGRSSMSYPSSRSSGSYGRSSGTPRYSAPSRSYPSGGSSHGYSAPSHSYPSGGPSHGSSSRGYSAPSHSSSSHASSAGRSSASSGRSHRS